MTIFIICIIYITYAKTEHYDLIIPNISVIECGTKCTNGTNCSAFAYKPTENKCYLSKSSILGQPEDGLYSNEYSKLDRRCNKINKMIEENRIDNNSLTQNSIYMCSDGEYGLSTRFQYANLGASSLESTNSTIYDRANADILTPVNMSYDVHEIEFPKTIPDKNAILNIQEPIKTNNYGFLESDKEYLGQYLLGHQCVVNTSLIDCLSYCKNNSKCSGVEWNEKFTDENGVHGNVCCPKSIIKQIIPRRTKFENGKFYVKHDIEKLNKQKFNDIISLSKENISNIENKNNLSIVNVDTNLDNNPRMYLIHKTPNYVKQEQ